MNCIVTAGPTHEPLDDVRRVTNFSTGRLGTELANFLTRCGHKVTLLIGEQATYTGKRRAQKIITFSTTEDLQKKLKAFRGHKVDAVFHAAAVSDFAFGKIFAEKSPGQFVPVKSAKKISTSQGALLAELVPTPKVISELRGWFPRAKIYGWKFEANGGRAAALKAGARQLAECSTDFCVVNGPAYGKGFNLLGARGSTHLVSAEKLFAKLQNVLVTPRSS